MLLKQKKRQQKGKLVWKLLKIVLKDKDPMGNKLMLLKPVMG